jgi:hypothetical protein
MKPASVKPMKFNGATHGSGAGSPTSSVTCGQIFVVNIAGKNVIVAMDKNDTVLDIKKKFQDKEGIPAEKLINVQQ